MEHERDNTHAKRPQNLPGSHHVDAFTRLQTELNEVPVGPEQRHDEKNAVYLIFPVGEIDVKTGRGYPEGDKQNREGE